MKLKKKWNTLCNVSYKKNVIKKQNSYYGPRKELDHATGVDAFDVESK